jgi:ERCC4-related helicase
MSEEALLFSHENCAPHVRATVSGVMTEEDQLTKVCALFVPWLPPPRADPAAAATFQVPEGLREYQLEAAVLAGASGHNTLCCLPTGYGKTLVASTVMANFLRWHPTGLTVFLVPTRPLCKQQTSALRAASPGLRADAITVMEGETSDAGRRHIWRSARVIVMTAAMAARQFRSAPAEDVARVCLLIVDEAHRAAGASDFAKAVLELDGRGVAYRLLALTATPGASLPAVQNLCRRLHISAIDIRSEGDVSLSSHAKDVLVDHVIVRPDPVDASARQRLLSLIGAYTKSLCSLGIIPTAEPEKLKVAALTAGRATMARLLADRTSTLGRANPQAIAVVRARFSLVLELVSALNDFDAHGSAALHANMVRIHARATLGDEPRRQVTQSQEWRWLASLLDTRGSAHEHTGSAKLEGLTRTIADHLEANPAGRVMVFVNARARVDTVLNFIAANGGRIVGHTTSKDGGGSGPGARLRAVIASAFVGQAKSTAGKTGGGAGASAPPALAAKVVGQVLRRGATEEEDGEDGEEEPLETSIADIVDLVDELAETQGRARAAEEGRTVDAIAAKTVAHLRQVSAYLPAHRVRLAEAGQSQAAQQAAIEAFKLGVLPSSATASGSVLFSAQARANTLVCTSVAEEGLDIGAASLVILFDPSESRSTVQRIGRVGRLKAGRAVALVTPEMGANIELAIRKHKGVADAVHAAALGASMPSYQFVTDLLGAASGKEAADSVLTVPFLCPGYIAESDDCRVHTRPPGAVRLTQPIPFARQRSLVSAMLSGSRVRHPAGFLLPRVVRVSAEEVESAAAAASASVVQLRDPPLMSTGSGPYESPAAAPVPSPWIGPAANPKPLLPLPWAGPASASLAPIGGPTGPLRPVAASRPPAAAASAPPALPWRVAAPTAPVSSSAVAAALQGGVREEAQGRAPPDQPAKRQRMTLLTEYHSTDSES